MRVSSDTVRRRIMGITNTTKTATMFDALPGMIEASESRGQAELVTSTLLPTDMRGDREKFEKMRFVFGEVVKDDPLFVNATLPAGWKKERTDHAMWSKIVDEKGNERASIFYKAVFYDRNAHMFLRGRYRVEGPYSDDSTGPRTAKIVDQKTGEVIHTLTRDAGPKEWDTANSNANDAAFEWLDANRPKHRDPLAWLED
jgi:hypothetical protein